MKKRIKTFETEKSIDVKVVLNNVTDFKSKLSLSKGNAKNTNNRFPTLNSKPRTKEINASDAPLAKCRNAIDLKGRESIDDVVQRGQTLCKYIEAKKNDRRQVEDLESLRELRGIEGIQDSPSLLPKTDGLKKMGGLETERSRRLISLLKSQKIIHLLKHRKNQRSGLKAEKAQAIESPQKATSPFMKYQSSKEIDFCRKVTERLKSESGYGTPDGNPKKPTVIIENRISEQSRDIWDRPNLTPTQLSQTQKQLISADLKRKSIRNSLDSSSIIMVLSRRKQLLTETGVNRKRGVAKGRKVKLYRKLLQHSHNEDQCSPWGSEEVPGCPDDLSNVGWRG